MEDKTLSDTSLGLFVAKGIPPVGHLFTLVEFKLTNLIFPSLEFPSPRKKGKTKHFSQPFNSNNCTTGHQQPVRAEHSLDELETGVSFWKGVEVNAVTEISTPCLFQFQ